MNSEADNNAFYYTSLDHNIISKQIQDSLGTNTVLRFDIPIAKVKLTYERIDSVFQIVFP